MAGKKSGLGEMDVKALAWKGAKWYLGIGAVWAGVRVADRLVGVARGAVLPPWKLPEAQRTKAYLGWLTSPLEDLALWPFVVVNTARGIVQVATAYSKAGRAFPVEMLPIVGAFKAPKLPESSASSERSEPAPGSTKAATDARAEAFLATRFTRHALNG